MYILERLFALSIYVLILIIITNIIYKNKYKSLKKILLIYTLILSGMGFLFVPAKGNDLYRIYLALDSYSKMDFSTFLNNLDISSTPLATIYYYAIAQIGYYRLLPAITCFITFNNLFYIIIDYSKKKKIDSKAISFTVLFIMATGFYFDVISGIRTFFAFSILARCFYDEMYNNKKMYYNSIFYIIACLIHASAFGILLLRFIFLIFNNKEKMVYKIIPIIILIIAYIIAKEYFYSAIEKLDSYVNNSTYFWIWDFIKILIIVAISIFVIKNDQWNRNHGFYYLVITFMAIFIDEFSMFARFGYFSVMISIPMFMSFFSNSTSLKNKQFVNIITITILLISCARGNLTSLKFFEL